MIMFKVKVMLSALLLSSLMGYTLGHDASGLYLSNATDILYTPDPERHDAYSIYKSQKGGRIVGLDVDVRDSLVFWSDISIKHRGIYKAIIGENGMIENEEKIITSDIYEVNSISVDWVSNHIYWTDTVKRSIKVSDFAGRFRRLLSLRGLLQPRCVHVDPLLGYIFWSDQGTQTISRARLDGSEQRTIVDSQVVWPNELSTYKNQLYWVDAWTNQIMRCDLDGSNIQSLISLVLASNNNPVFGLTIKDSTAFITSWYSGMVTQVDLNYQRWRNLLKNVGQDAMFSATYVDPIKQRVGENPCQRLEVVGCSHLCMPVDASQYHCSCPSHGGLVLDEDGKNCREPKSILLYAAPEDGQVGFLDPDAAHTQERYLVANSRRPIAVGYDPTEQFVYWSDVDEKAIHRVRLGGSDRETILSYNDSLGVVDDLVVDYNRQQLYFSNEGHIEVAGALYAWHKIEILSLTDRERRTLYSASEKPRGLWLDADKGLLYHTDWGSNPSVLSSTLDGSVTQILHTMLDNPNDVLVSEDRLYYVDSHAKTRDDTKNPNYPGESKQGALYVSDLGGGLVNIVDQVNLMTPFSLASSPNLLFISDWGYESIWAVEKTSLESGPLQITSLLRDIKSVSGLHYSTASLQREDYTCEKLCQGVCISGQNSASITGTERYSCLCDSYTPHVFTEPYKCSGPKDIVMVADMNSIKMMNVNEEGDQSVYQIVSGSTYYASMTGLVYDQRNGLVYFTDVNRRTINSFNIQLDVQSVFYSYNGVFEYLVLDSSSGYLYWTDYLNGIIARVQTDLTDNNRLHEIIIGDLRQPRGLALDSSSGLLYWTSWGSEAAVGKVSMANVSDVSVIVNTGLKQPNSIKLADEGTLVIADALKGVIKCNRDGSDCLTLNYIKSESIYDILLVNNWIIYSDWSRKAILMASMESGEEVTLMENLMRPSQMSLFSRALKECPHDHGCEHGCLPHLAGYVCRCIPGEKLSPDGHTCHKVYDGWEKLSPEKCEQSCKKGSVCAHLHGTTIVSCQCEAGLRQLGSTCQGCPYGTYKPYIGTSDCKPCPGLSTSHGSGSTRCECPPGLVWNWKESICSDSIDGLPGTCPKFLPLGKSCEQACAHQTDCSGAQKCCDVQLPSGDRCPQPQCLDPVGLEECIVDGRPYEIGETFQPDVCTSCICLADKGRGSPDHGLATCRIETCPTLACDEDHRVHDAEQCCPSCMLRNEKALELINCPDELVILQLGEDFAFVEYKTNIYASDNRWLQRDITITKNPNIDRFWWVSNIRSTGSQTIKVTASARSPDGDLDVDECSYTVFVQDRIPPSITCPADIDAFVRTASDTTYVTWSDPITGDNVAIDAPPLLNGQIDSQLGIGSVDVHYSVRDRAGNYARCSFEINVRVQDISCSLPTTTPNHGRIECTKETENSITVDMCQLHCYEPYQVNDMMNIHSFYRCANETWSPSFVVNFDTLACVVRKTKRWWVYGEVTFPALSLNTEAKDIEVGFMNLVEDHYLRVYDLQAIIHVQVDTSQHPTQPDDQSFLVTFTLEGPDRFTSQLIGNDFRNMMAQMQLDTNRTNLVISGNGELVAARPYSLFYDEIVMECDRGEQLVHNECMVCPSGTYYDIGREKCSACPIDSYQPQEGALHCIPCPRGLYSLSGSYSIQQCFSEELLPTEFPIPTPAQSGSQQSDIIIPVSVGVGLFLFVAIVVATVVIVVRHCAGGGKFGGDGNDGGWAMQFNNSTFVGDLAMGMSSNLKRESFSSERVLENGYH